MRFRSRNVLLAATALLLVEVNNAGAQQPEPAEKDDVEEVVVTGTNMRGLPREYVASPVFTC